MAKAGLLYTGQEEEVQCKWCGVILREWQYGDQVMARHRMSSPQCPFVLNQSDNVPFVPGDSNSTPAATNTNNSVPEDTDDVGPETPRHPHILQPYFPPLNNSSLIPGDRNTSLLHPMYIIHIRIISYCISSNSSLYSCFNMSLHSMQYLVI